MCEFSGVERIFHDQSESPPGRPPGGGAWGLPISHSGISWEPPKSTPGAAVMYMRARRRRRCPHARARETRNKTHHGPPVAPPARAWRVLFRVSRAREPMYPRCRGLRGRASHPKVSFLAVWGGRDLRFFGISGFPGKSGSITVTGGCDHVHKILVCETGMFLETLSEVYV